MFCKRRIVSAWLLALGVALAATACSAIVGPGTRTSVPTYATTRTQAAASNPGEDDQIAAAARAVAEAMALVNYQNPAPWKNRLLELSSDDGKKFWELNFDRMLADVVAHRRVSEKVTVERVAILTKETQTDTQGRKIAAAGVVVTGRVAYSDDTGHHDDPINQPMLLGNLKGRWEFVALISPELLTPAAK